VDLLRLPVIGPALRWRHARTSLQLVLLLAAVVIVVHGLTGPELASTNLATVATWVHYRGLLVVALLAVGNLFCTGCPFVRVRDWGRRLHMPSLSWPSRLRGKWVGVLLFVAVLFTYELFDLWALPAATAWLVLAYFGTALIIDVTFRGASFCQYVCPIGQFNFVASTASPFEITVRNRSTCDACQTADCVAGRKATTGETTTVVQRGCELGLFLPAKTGNLDCTLCLDCVQACPHDNVALHSRVPARELADDSRRSVVGRLIDRTDILGLIVVFVFGALVNAGAMTAPVHAALVWTSERLGNQPEGVTLALLFIAGLLLLPAVAIGLPAAATKSLTGGGWTVSAVARRFVPALVPLGAGVWVAHYSFHLLTGLLVIVPVTQSAAIDMFGWAVLGEPLWRLTGVRSGLVFPLQLGAVLLGALGSTAVTLAVAQRDFDGRASRAAWPWFALLALLAAAACWVLAQPMDMRGTGL
jgi:polyferredoxin